ncbi:MAG: PAS domain S-box protein [Actinomycetota bacterium]|nr:PAS domain S-box protein [Actinomycetota bacterium]
MENKMGSSDARTGLATLVEEQDFERTEALLSGQAEILEGIASGAGLDQTLDALVRMLETLTAPAQCSILLLDETESKLVHGAAPSLPRDFTEAIDGIEIGPHVGSCGTSAYTGSPDFVTDIKKDERCKRFRKIALSHGLRACWSVPIRTSDGVVGTFAVYHDKPASPTPADVAIIEHSAKLAAIAIERDRTRQDLLRGEERFRLLVQNSWDAISLVDKEGVFRYAGPAVSRITGFEPEEIVGRSGFDFVHPTDLPNVQRAHVRMLEGSQTETLELRVLRKDESWVWVELRATNCLADPSIEGIVLNYHDITKRKLMQEEQTRREASLRFLLEELPGTLWTTDTDLIVTSGTGRGIRAMGLDPEETAGSNITEWVGSDRSFTPYAAHVNALKGKSTSYDMEFRERRLKCRVEPLRDENGEITGTIGMSFDVTDFEHVKEARQRLAAVLEVSSDVVIVTSPEGVVLVLNAAGRALLGKDDGDSLEDVDLGDLYPDWSKRIIEEEALPSARERGVWVGELSHVDRHGREIPVSQMVVAHRDEKGEIDFYAYVGRDISERQAIEAQLLHAQKMEVVGRLAGGVAHDFNNLLSVIINYVGFLREEIHSLDPRTDYLDEIQRAGERGAKLVSRLLAFSRRDVSSPQPLIISDLVIEIEALLRQTLREDIDLEIKAEGGLWPIKGDSGQIERVLMNLATNARDAIDGRGNVSIELTNIPAEDLKNAAKHGMAVVDYVRLNFSDDGSGMGDDVMDHIFEPFFTTKKREEGTGLGLSIVYGIVKNLGGHVTVASEPGKGTTFSLYFPSTFLSGPQAEGGPEKTKARGGTERVLVVEDEAAIRRLMVKILARAGYDVVASGGADEAFELMKDRERPFDLLITDVVMPGLSGNELAAELRDRYGGLKVLFMSGYSGEVVGDIPEAAFIPKPFDKDQLLEKVRRVLASE